MVIYKFITESMLFLCEYILTQQLAQVEDVVGLTKFWQGRYWRGEQKQWRNLCNESH